MSKICVFAGTADGRELIRRLEGRGAGIVACVATEYGGELLKDSASVRVHAGRMDAEAMAAFFAREEFALVVDATHPYAVQVSENIRSACASRGIPCHRLRRSSQAEAEDGIWVSDAAACAEYLRGTEGNVFLTTGSKDLAVFCVDARLRERIYARVLPLAGSLEICTACGIPPERIIAMQGPFDEALNAAMFRAANARYVVTKDTGSAGGYGEKIAAAHSAGAQALIIGRPAQAEGLDLDTLVARLEAWLHLEPPRKKVWLVGVGMGERNSRTLEADHVLRRVDRLIGAKRLLQSADLGDQPRSEAILPEEIERIIREDSVSRRFAVLLSGDSGFFSGAKRLVGVLRGMDVEVLPGVGSLSWFCARLKRSWEEVRSVSLHGRDCDLVGEVRRNDAVFALLGGGNTARAALERLCEAGLGDLQVHVGERLGYPDEAIASGAVQDLVGRDFDALSVMLIENPRGAGHVVTHGLEDAAFDRGDVPMTKSEVRSISLSKLRLTSNAVAFDIGSGSGSVSVEMALQARSGRVFAIEKKEDAAVLTRRNAGKFGLTNLTVIHGTAPQALSDLPAPTHAFIGGSSGSMGQVIDCLLKKNPRVRIVANAITLETVAELSQIAKSFDDCDIAEVSIAKPRAVGDHRLMTAQNPVYVFALQNGGDPS